MVGDTSQQQSCAKAEASRTGGKREMSVDSAASRKFSKSRRLLKHADFQRVYQCGRRQFTGNMTVFFLRRNEGEATRDATLRVGLTVGKVLGGAVERNRIRRRMREAMRLVDCGNWGAVDVVFHPRKCVLTLPFSELTAEVGRGLQLAVQRARVAQPDQR